MTVSKRLDSLDALRALSCLGIICFHIYLTMLGYLYVCIFFMLSGFLMVYSYYDRLDTSSLTAGGCLKFSLKKIKKLYPLHILTLLIPLAEQMYGLLSGLAEPSVSFFAPIAANILLVHSWVPRVEYFFSLNITSWYLSVALFQYAMFPLILKCIRKYTKPVHGLAGAAVIYAVQLLGAAAVLGSEGTNQWLTYVFPVFRLGDFAIGCNLGYWFITSKEKERSQTAANIFELSAIALWLLTEKANVYQWVPGFMKYTNIYVPVAVMLIFAFAYGGGLPVKLLTNKVTLYIASVSSYVFLIHSVVTNVCSIVLDRAHIPAVLSKPLYIFCVFFISFALAELFRHFSSRKTLS